MRKNEWRPSMNQSAAGILPANQSEKSTAGKMPAAPWRCRLTCSRFIVSTHTRSEWRPPMNPYSLSCLSRRDLLWRFGGGLGGVALAHLLGAHCLLAADETGSLAPSSSALAGVLRNGTHHPARARRVIQLFMNGGASQMDLFDHKPE